MRKAPGVSIFPQVIYVKKCPIAWRNSELFCYFGGSISTCGHVDLRHAAYSSVIVWHFDMMGSLDFNLVIGHVELVNEIKAHKTRGE